MTSRTPTAATPAFGNRSVHRVVALVVAQIVNLTAVLAVVRLYPPAAYGGFAVLFGIATIVAGVSALRLDVALTTAQARDAPVLERLARRLNLAIGAAAGLVVLAGAMLIGPPTTARLVEGAAFGAVTALFGLSNTLTYMCVREQRYGLVAVSRLAMAGTCATTQIGLGMLWPVPGALLAGSAAGYAASVLVMALWRGRAEPPVPGVSGAVLRRHRGFVVASAPANLLNSLALHLPVLLTATVLGAVAAADLALALRVGLLPLALLGQALLPLLFGKIAQQVRDAPADAVTTYDRALVRMLAAGTGAIALLAVTVHLSSPWLLGPDWTGVGPILLLLTPFLVAQFAVAPLSQTLNALGRNREQLLWDAGRVTAVATVFIPAILGWVSLPTTVALFSVVSAVAYGWHVRLSRRALRHQAALPDRAADARSRPAEAVSQR